MSKTSFYSGIGVTPTQTSAIESSVSAAKASEDAALASKDSASASAITAATKASEASASASTAANSETNAGTSATNSAASAVTAANDATTATAKSGEASASSTAAAASEANAATSETNAATSATAASGSAAAASNSQIAAANSAASAASVFDQFDDTYLGSKVAPPTLDNDGNALVTGALYYDSALGGMYIWDGTEWIAASAAGGVSLNYFNYTATAGQTTFTGVDDDSNSLVYVQNNLLVLLNGIIIQNGTDYTASDGTSIVLTDAAVALDELNVVAFKSFTTADMVSGSTGGTFYGNVDFSAGIDVTGAITVTGAVDGRDVAADGTKLDGIEASADVTDAANVQAAGAVMDSEVTNLSQVKAFDTSDYATAAQGALADTSTQPSDLGTAAAANTGDFATAAQGALADTATQPSDLGTAATTAASDYATAAQGALADTALQPSSSLAAANLTGTLPAIDGSALTGIEGVPAGVVIYQAANTAPTGFIKANGASLSTTTYANLFAAIGYTFGGSGSSFNVPDLRGEFMRGWDDSRGIDSSRVFGSSQVDAIKDHEHRVFRASIHGSSNIHYSNLYRGFGYNDFGTSSVANSGRSGPLYSGGGYSETRPRNIALLACIKY